MAPEIAPTAVFDLDGTLVDTAEDLIATLNAIGSTEGLPRVSLEDGRTMIGHGARAMIVHAFAQAGRTLGPPHLERLAAAFLAYYVNHLANRSRPFPGADAALHALASAGWRLAVCTNKHEASARRLLALLGLAHHFAVIAGQDTFGFRKPDPRHLTETIRTAGGAPRRAVMVGDSLTDVDTAIAAGIPVVAVAFGYSVIPVGELGADRVVADFRDLPDVLASLVPGIAPAGAPG